MLIFLDLKKAFDSVDRNTLLKKLEYIGVLGTALAWFASYLTNRIQRVSIDGVESCILSVDYGVIQGSTLGPILFLIYINNISKITLKGKVFLFADDTLIFEKGNTWQEVKNNTVSDLAALKK